MAKLPMLLYLLAAMLLLQDRKWTSVSCESVNEASPRSMILNLEQDGYGTTLISNQQPVIAELNQPRRDASIIPYPMETFYFPGAPDGPQSNENWQPTIQTPRYFQNIGLPSLQPMIAPNSDFDEDLTRDDEEAALGNRIRQEVPYSDDQEEMPLYDTDEDGGLIHFHRTDASYPIETGAHDEPRPQLNTQSRDDGQGFFRSKTFPYVINPVDLGTIPGQDLLSKYVTGLEQRDISAVHQYQNEEVMIYNGGPNRQGNMRLQAIEPYYDDEIRRTIKNVSQDHKQVPSTNLQMLNDTGKKNERAEVNGCQGHVKIQGSEENTSHARINRTCHNPVLNDMHGRQRLNKSTSKTNGTLNTMWVINTGSDGRRTQNLDSKSLPSSTKSTYDIKAAGTNQRTHKNILSYKSTYHRNFMDNGSRPLPSSTKIPHSINVTGTNPGTAKNASKYLKNASKKNEVIQRSESISLQNKIINKGAMWYNQDDDEGSDEIDNNDIDDIASDGNDDEMEEGNLVPAKQDDLSTENNITSNLLQGGKQSHFTQEKDSSKVMNKLSNGTQSIKKTEDTRKLTENNNRTHSEKQNVSYEKSQDSSDTLTKEELADLLSLNTTVSLNRNQSTSKEANSPKKIHNSPGKLRKSGLATQSPSKRKFIPAKEMRTHRISKNSTIKDIENYYPYPIKRENISMLVKSSLIRHKLDPSPLAIFSLKENSNGNNSNTSFSNKTSEKSNKTTKSSSTKTTQRNTIFVNVPIYRTETADIVHQHGIVRNKSTKTDKPEQRFRISSRRINEMTVNDTRWVLSLKTQELPNSFSRPPSSVKQRPAILNRNHSYNHKGDVFEQMFEKETQPKWQQNRPRYKTNSVIRQSNIQPAIPELQKSNFIKNESIASTNRKSNGLLLIKVPLLDKQRRPNGEQEAFVKGFQKIVTKGSAIVTVRRRLTKNQSMRHSNRKLNMKNSRISNTLDISPKPNSYTIWDKTLRNKKGRPQRKMRKDAKAFRKDLISSTSLQSRLRNRTENGNFARVAKAKLHFINTRKTSVDSHNKDIDSMTMDEGELAP